MPRKSKRPAKRRARGSGSIFYSKTRGVWVARTAVGRYDNALGTTKYKEFSAPTQGEVVEWLRRQRL